MRTAFHLSQPKAPTAREEFALSFVVGTHNPADEEKLYRVAQDARQILIYELAPTITASLGSKFRLQRIDIGRVEVRVLVYIVGPFTLLSQYPDFLRSLESLMRQIEGVVRRIFSEHCFQHFCLATGWTNLTTGHPRRRAPFPTCRNLLEFAFASSLILISAVLSVVTLYFVFQRFLLSR